MRSRYLFLFFFLAELLLTRLSFAQTSDDQPSFGYSVPLQRLQLKLISSYVYFSFQGHLDMDSSAIMASEGERLPYSLYYDQDFRDGADNHIKTLLEKGSHSLFKSGTSKSDLDSALTFLIVANSEADKMGDTYWQNASLAALG